MTRLVVVAVMLAGCAAHRPTAEVRSCPAGFILRCADEKVWREYPKATLRVLPDSREEVTIPPQAVLRDTWPHGACGCTPDTVPVEPGERKEAKRGK